MKKRVLIVNGTQDCGSPYEPLFAAYKQYRVNRSIETFRVSPRTYSLVLFTGGPDITPSLYGDESPSGLCKYNELRDNIEVVTYNYAKTHNIPMIGVCRGMQFLNVMTGGKMMHDVTGHLHGSHVVEDRHGGIFTTNSYHHQICIPDESTHIIAWSIKRKSRCYIGDNDMPVRYTGPEIEAIYNPEALVAGVQWHPEVAITCGMQAESVKWFRRLADILTEKDRGYITKACLGGHAKLTIEK